MSLLIKAAGLKKAFGPFDVLAGVSIEVARGERIGLVGSNGSGKSTLLKILAGKIRPDAGHAGMPGRPTVGYLPQEIDFPAGCTLFAAASDDLPSEPPEWEVAEMLAALEFPEARWEQSASALSGGERTRLMLARLLLARPDLLLLDEPTNHLDLRMIEWLEGYLRRFRGAMLVVSHDRRFLDRTVTRILELDGGMGRDYAGGYSDYVRKKQEELRRQQAAYQRQQEEIQALKAFISRARERAGSIGEGPKRGRDHYGRVAEKVARLASAGEKRLDRMEKVAKPWESEQIQARFRPEARHGGWAVQAQGLAKRYGARTLFSGVDLALAYGDRAGIIGPNGSGKTTLLRVLLGQEAPSAGEARIGISVKVGHLAQHQENLDPSRTLLEEIMEERSATETEIRALLACFLFRRDEVQKKVGSLSSGERVRLALAKLLASGCNLMVLDEPTHHLDVATRERMEEALEAFSGTLIVVSHDRLLLDRLATQLVIVEEGRVVRYPGNYSDYLQRGRDDERVSATIRAIALDRAEPAPDSTDGKGRGWGGHSDETKSE